MEQFRILTCLAILILPCYTESVKSRSYTLVELINGNYSSWTAGKNFPDDVTPEDLKRLNGVIGLHPDPKFQLSEKRYKMAKSVIPESFDAREKWSECGEVIGNIRNQGNCGSCWAFASAEVMSDRLCIRSNGTVKFQFSPEDLLECCADCTDVDKCKGGYASLAWEYWISNGIVSGGDYDSDSGCKPYTASAYNVGIAPTCSQNCQSSYGKSYTKDKKFGGSLYQVNSDPQQIQMEIMTNGPVVAIYEVYEDFYYYRYGVYKHIMGRKYGYHAVKIIGWGSDYGVPYWLVANSWGADWAGLEGFFKIWRGENHCQIEEYVIGGMSSSPVTFASYFGTVVAAAGVLLRNVIN